MAEIDELRARLSALEDELTSLKARLDAEAAWRRGLMRDTRRCPACGHRKIFHAQRLQTIPNHYKFSCLHIETKGIFSPTLLGVVQAFICAACGHAEMQIENPQNLEGKKSVRLLEASDHQEGPYR